MENGTHVWRCHWIGREVRDTGVHCEIEHGVVLTLSDGAKVVQEIRAPSLIWPLTPEWVTSRAAALREAARRVQDASVTLAMQAEKLRNQAAEVDA